MPGVAHLSDQRITFDAVSSSHARLDSASFRGRVPVVFAFVGTHGPRADAAIVGLDRSLYRFSERRIRLLVVVDGHPSELVARLAVRVRLIIDDGLAEELKAEVDDQGQIS